MLGKDECIAKAIENEVAALGVEPDAREIHLAAAKLWRRLADSLAESPRYPEWRRRIEAVVPARVVEDR